MRIQTKRLLLWVVVLIIIGVVAFFGIEYQKSTPIIRTFDDCVIAGKAVINSVPQRCEISSGQFIVDIKGIVGGEIGGNGTCGSYTFENYKIDDALKTRVLVDYTTYPNGKKEELSDTVKKIIEESIRNGPNFSGYYFASSWNCGASCQESVIIDGRTGKFLITGVVSKYGIDTKKDSKLFIVNPIKNIPTDITAGEDERASLITSYYTLESDGLNLICRERTYKK